MLSFFWLSQAILDHLWVGWKCSEPFDSSSMVLTESWGQAWLQATMIFSFSWEWCHLYFLINPWDSPKKTSILYTWDLKWRALNSIAFAIRLAQIQFSQFKWPHNGILYRNFIRDLYNYTDQLRKWKVIPHSLHANFLCSLLLAQFSCLIFSHAHGV